MRHLSIFDISRLAVSLRKFYLVTLICFSGKMLFYFSEMEKDCAKNVWESFAGFDIYLSNRVIATIVLRDLDLLFEGQHLHIFIYRK